MKPTVLAIIVAILAIPIIVLLVMNHNSKPTSPAPLSTDVPSAKPSDPVDPADTVSAKQIVLSTDKGDITINLYPNDAPHTVKNFVTLGKRGYYNGIIFHRVIKSFVIQAGDPTGTGQGGESIYGKNMADEINSHKIVKGTLAMANAGPNTNGSQFFIVTQTDQPSLDGHYTVFGQIDPASQGTVDAIAAVPTDSNDKPTADVKITGFRIVQ